MSPTAVPCWAVHCSAVSAGRAEVPTSAGGASGAASLGGAGSATGAGSGAGGGASNGTSAGGGVELPQPAPAAKSRDETANCRSACDIMAGASPRTGSHTRDSGSDTAATTLPPRLVGPISRHASARRYRGLFGRRGSAVLSHALRRGRAPTIPCIGRCRSSKRSPVPWLHIAEARGAHRDTVARRELGVSRQTRRTCIIGEFGSKGCHAVVLGCTEIPLLVDDTNSPLPTLDSTRLLARAALRRAVGERAGQIGSRIELDPKILRYSS